MPRFITSYGTPPCKTLHLHFQSLHISLKKKFKNLNKRKSEQMIVSAAWLHLLTAFPCYSGCNIIFMIISTPSHIAASRFPFSIRMTTQRRTVIYSESFPAKKSHQLICQSISLYTKCYWCQDLTSYFWEQIMA